MTGPEVERALQTLAASMAGEDAPPVVEQRLLAGFRARRRRRAAFLWAEGLAAAGIAAAVVALMVVPRRIETMPQVRIAHAGPAPEWKPLRAAPAQVRAARRTPRPKPPVEPQVEEVASDFFRIRPGPLVEAGELAPMLRVQVPRLEMRRFGLPAGPDPWAPIDADVVLGRDGAPNAIRFVLTGGAARQRY